MWWYRRHRSNALPDLSRFRNVSGLQSLQRQELGRTRMTLYFLGEPVQTYGACDRCKFIQHEAIAKMIETGGD